jgi:hypothetical protein
LISAWQIDEGTASLLDDHLAGGEIPRAAAVEHRGNAPPTSDRKVGAIAQLGACGGAGDEPSDALLRRRQIGARRDVNRPFDKRPAALAQALGAHAVVGLCDERSLVANRPHAFPSHWLINDAQHDVSVGLQSKQTAHSERPARNSPLPSIPSMIHRRVDVPRAPLLAQQCIVRTFDGEKLPDALLDSQIGVTDRRPIGLVSLSRAGLEPLQRSCPRTIGHAMCEFEVCRTDVIHDGERGTSQQRRSRGRDMTTRVRAVLFDYFETLVTRPLAVSDHGGRLGFAEDNAART